MRRIVRDGYENGSYAEKFRYGREVNDFERSFLDQFLELMPANPRVVDFGCGIGIPFDRYLVERGAELTGLDLSTRHIAEASANVPGATFIEADFSAWQPPRLFDGLLCLYAIFHVPRAEHDALLTHMAQVLTDGGVILCSLPGHALEGAELDWHGVPMVWSAHPPDYYVDELEGHGFEILRDGYEGTPGHEEFHYWVLARKGGRAARPNA